LHQKYLNETDYPLKERVPFYVFINY